MLTLTYTEALLIGGAFFLVNLLIIAMSVYALKKQAREFRARQIMRTLGERHDN